MREYSNNRERPSGATFSRITYNRTTPGILESRQAHAARRAALVVDWGGCAVSGRRLLRRLPQLGAGLGEGVLGGVRKHRIAEIGDAVAHRDQADIDLGIGQ